MRLAYIDHLASALEALHRDWHYCQQQIGYAPPRKEDYERISGDLDELHTYFDHVGLKGAARKILQSQIQVRKGKADFSSLATELRNVVERVREDLGEPIFVVVQSRFSNIFEHERGFGDEVWKAFPAARKDIKDAGTCLGAECGTASVFHLMRVAEVGLRVLAYDRRVPLPQNKPIELTTWHDLLDGLNKAEKDIRNYPNTLAREAQFDFYHGAIMQVDRFKNVFRNRVSHKRESFSLERAVDLYRIVREFMQILAVHLTEGKRTPKIWKGSKWVKVEGEDAL